METPKWAYWESGLAIIRITLAPEAHSIIPNFDNLVEYLVRSTVPDKKTQADFSLNPFLLSEPDADGNRHLRILANSAARDTTCWKLLQELRLYVKDYGGDSRYVFTPDVHHNQVHGVLIAKGFKIEEYDAWGIEHCSRYRSPWKRRKKVLDSLVA